MVPEMNITMRPTRESHQITLFSTQIALATLAIAFSTSTPATIAQPTRSDPETTASEPAQQSEAPDIASFKSEIKALRQKIKTLMSQMAEMHLRIATLEKQVAELNGKPIPPSSTSPSLSSPDPGNPPQPNPSDTQSAPRFHDLTISPDQPLASPESAFLKAQQEYNTTFADLSYQTSREKLNYLRRIRQWMPRINRELTGKITWTCNLQNIRTTRNGAAFITVQVTNPSESDEIRSRPHVIEVSKLIAMSLERLPSPSVEKPNRVLLTGIFRLRLELDEDRAEAEFIEEPYLVGPFVNFNYEIDVRSIAPATLNNSKP